ncbi:MAG: efflux RND transporter permease subunit [Woeseiaceae bacterium]
MRVRTTTSEKGLIAWWASNHVAANLLMWLIIVAGLISAVTIRKQTTPDFDLNLVQVRVPYLGAAPQEVEEGVVIKVEEAIQDIQGIKEINSTSAEGMGSVTVEVSRNYDVDDILAEVKTRIDAISTFPALTEKPLIYKVEPDIPVIFVTIHGNLDQRGRKIWAQEVQNELLAMPEISKVMFYGEPAYEISVEVSEQVLRKYGLTMSEVSQAIRDSSVDMPGGTIRTEGGDIRLRTEGQVYAGHEFAELVLRTYPDGTRLTLGDIATIKDGFVEDAGYGRFDGTPDATLNVLATGQQNELKTAAAVKEYAERKAKELPDGVKMDLWIDRSHYLKGRLTMMLKNMIMGAVLVFIMLSMFLRMKVAGWVIMGIPLSFLGTLWLMPHGPWPVTINMISLFGFIIVLGIVVDDAIIIGESVYTQIRKDGHTIDSVVKGAKRVALPATFGVLTTIAAFAPMLFIGGFAGPFFAAMSVVVILCLFFSLMESKLILPAHLVHANIKPVDEDDLFRPQRPIGAWERIPRFFQKIQRHVQHGLHRLIYNGYQPLLEKAIRNRGLTAAAFTGGLILTFGLFSGGLVRFVMFPEVPGDFVQMSMEMESGTPPEVRDAAVDRIESAMLDMNEEYNAAHPDGDPLINHMVTYTTSDTGAEAFVELPMVEDREMNVKDISAMWRNRVGEIPGVKDLTFSDGNNFGGGPPLSFRLSGDNYDALESAAAELEKKLGEYEGVYDIRNSSNTGSREIRLKIKPQAEALGLTMATLGRQVRQAFYGEEAQRIQRGKDELKVMVRYPPEERRSIADLENMRIRTPDGTEVPFESVADVSFDRTYTVIQRKDRERTVTVSANLDPNVVEPGKVISSINEEFIPGLLARYSGVKYGLEGSSEEQQTLQRNMAIAAIAALFLIYALIAIPLHSYSQPLIIMSVIPFGFIGAVIGHVVMGMAISMFSLFGLIALAGVVVNDSLVMVDFINKARLEGVPLQQAVIESGTERFRAIMLTSLTTAAGLLPILLERSVQAQYVIPMAISLGFGILFATAITLFLVPALYMLQLDGFAATRWAVSWLMGRDAASDVSETL